MPVLSAAAAAAEPIPTLAVAPFVLLLLSIAVLPIAAHHWWESNRNRGLVSAALGLPVAVWLLAGPTGGAVWLKDAVLEYAAFLALLGSLFVVSGGVYVRGSLAGTPLVNTAVLGVGALVASFVGTTGASMLLIRPLLRANASRRRRSHLVVFFILIVSNCGGLLTPLGDPPLFLGFLRGVPFGWTFSLWGQWLLVNAALLVVFHFWDEAVLDREERDRPGSQLEDVQRVPERLRIEGAHNFLFLAGVIATNVGVGYAARVGQWSHLVRDVCLVVGMSAMAALSLATTSKRLRHDNRFTWAPIVEVAVVFAGIFVTMVPAMKLLDGLVSDGTVAIREPWQFFWATGSLSAFLDNAPTYVTFATVAGGVVGKAAGTHVDPSALGDLLALSGGEALLAAVSCGAVFMGALTYIGNGPNFMVKAIAEENGVKMPSFFAYFVWASAILLPVLVAVTLLFFR